FVGNSSAMYLEAQYLGVPCISIGERNFGREKAFKSHFSSDFRNEFGLREGWEKGKHGRGEASKRILDILERIDKPTREFLFKGSFY
ncbi:MAG: hypothetical protein U9P50_00330, partial [Patescibacteria group bacterium]|nr:hypothetical protein [Patescibacteria group bacterium]